MHETVGAHSYTHSGRISEVYRVPEIIIGLSETTGGRRPRYPQRSVATHSFEHRPAAVLFMAARPLLAGVVQQAPTDVLPDRRRPVEADGIGLLDLDDAAAAGARHP